jgi:hypothetical protein
MRISRDTIILETDLILISWLSIEVKSDSVVLAHSEIEFWFSSVLGKGSSSVP